MSSQECNLQVIPLPCPLSLHNRCISPLLNLISLFPQPPSTLTACPFSKVWGARPKYINVTIIPTTTTTSSTIKTAALTQLKVTLTPLLLSCGRLLDYALYFDPSGILAINSTDYAVCNYRNGQTSGTDPVQSLVCDLTTLSASSLSAGSKNGQLAWRVKGAGGWYTKLKITPIPLTFYTNVVPTSVIPLATSCALNQAAPVGCTSALATSQLCNGNYTCLNQPCITSTQTTQQQANTLYQYPTCAAAKHDARNKSCLTNLAYDNAGTCCRIDQQDCNGKCFGASFIALWTPPNFPKILPAVRTWICCPAVNTVDCAGYCIAPGQAGLERDACGKCGGTDKKGLGCSTGNIFPLSPVPCFLAPTMINPTRFYLAHLDLSISHFNINIILTHCTVSLFFAIIYPLYLYLS